MAYPIWSQCTHEGITIPLMTLAISRPTQVIFNGDEIVCVEQLNDQMAKNSSSICHRFF